MAESSIEVKGWDIHRPEDDEAKRARIIEEIKGLGFSFSDSDGLHHRKVMSVKEKDDGALEVTVAAKD